MTLDDQLHAIRHTVALCDADHVTCLRVSGAGAFDALDRLLPIGLYLQDGQMRHTLMLGDDGAILADAYVCLDDESFYLLVEGLDAAAVVGHAGAHLPAGVDVRFEDLREGRRLLSVGGPFAWELLAEAVDPEIVGLPYMTFFDMESWVCFRAGKTGEYGYDLLMPADRADATRARLLEVGERFELGTASLAALDQCALENWFFNVRREGRCGATPIELQLQWRLSYDKDYVGAAAVRAQRAAGAARRLTCLLSDDGLAVGDGVAREGRPVGEIVNAGFSAVRGDWVGMALIETGLAYPGIDFAVSTGDGATRPVRSVSPPVLNNRSIYVSPQMHSFAARGELEVPPLVTQ